MNSTLYLGLMSGTSMNGVDAAVAQFEDDRFIRVIASHTQAYPAPLRERLLRLAREQPALTLHEYAELDGAVALVFAEAANGALRRAGITPQRIAAIGSHGQTVFHEPRAPAHSSLQLGDPNLIAVRTGITTVADFRRKDIALGGQGAPLVPAFHHAVFASAGEPRCVVNIGGIANITLLPDTEPAHVRGFDTGPGNGLMDEWAQQHLGQAHDEAGAWAAQAAAPDENLLRALLQDPYFQQTPPKSTGRGHFNRDWVLRRYPAVAQLAPPTVQRTFCELTARTIAGAITAHAPDTRRVLLCGGGVNNRLLVQRLRALTHPRTVETTDSYGLNSQWVEAAAFAWLAMRTLNELPGNLPAVTGARALAVLGGIYPAS